MFHCIFESKIRSYVSVLFSTSYPSHHLASIEIVDRIAVRVKHTEARRLVVVLVRVPEHVHLVECLAGDRPPESLSILNGGNLYDGQ